MGVKKKRVGRPTKLTDELQEKICNLLRMGNFFETACAAAGITRETGRNWLRAGNSGKSRGRLSKARLKRFADAVDEAMAQGEARDVLALDRAIQADGKIALDRLARKFPDRWGKRSAVDITSGGEPVNPVQVIAVSPYAALGKVEG